MTALQFLKVMPITCFRFCLRRHTFILLLNGAEFHSVAHINYSVTIATRKVAIFGGILYGFCHSLQVNTMFVL
jgi:hypothetical protein